MMRGILTLVALVGAFVIGFMSGVGHTVENVSTEEFVAMKSDLKEAENNA